MRIVSGQLSCTMMFLPWRAPDTNDLHEQAFVARLDRILHWARQIASGDASLAEDLAQDAFLHFTTGKPSIEAIGSLDKYLYAVLRNLYRSHCAAISRRRAVSCDPLAHESAIQSWRSVNPERQLTLRRELLRICLFVCERKETSKGASAFLFHFFHGLSVAEVSAVMRTTRAAIDERLSVMRKETRRQMERSAPLLLKSNACGDADLMSGLYSVIASSCRGECFSAEDLISYYAHGSSELSRERLAHLSSCRNCLAAVIEQLQLRPPGASSSQPPSAGPKKARIARWQHRREEFLSVEPAELRLVVNGHVLATERVHHPDNDFSISVSLREPLDFLELWSGDETRLLFLPVLSEPPEGSFEQQSSVILNGGRLQLTLRFTEPWPTIAVNYQMTAGQCPHGPLDESHIVPNIFPSRKIGKATRRFSFHLPIPAFSAFVAVILVVVLLFVQTRETSLSAAELLTKAGDWQKNLTTVQKQVLHRRFSLVLQTRGEPMRRTFVEVWRPAGLAVKFSRWSDSSGRVLAEARLAPKDLRALNKEKVWEFDPSADAFAAAVPLDGATVSASHARMVIRARSAELVLDRATNRPVEERFLLPDGQYIFSEAATEIVPLSGSPLSPPLAVTPTPSRRIVSREPRHEELPASNLGEQQLEKRELQVRRELHGLQLAAVATVGRHDTMIDVELASTSAEQARQLRIAMERIPRVEVSILSPQMAVSRAVSVADSSAATPAQSKLREPLATGWLKPLLGSDLEIHAEEIRRIENARKLVGLIAELRLLAERYPVSTEGLLGSDARGILAEIVEDLRLRIRKDVDDEKRAIALMRNLPVNPLPVTSQKPCEDWQTWATQAADLLWENDQATEAFYAPVSVSGPPPSDVDSLARLRHLTEILDTTLQISCDH